MKTHSCKKTHWAGLIIIAGIIIMICLQGFYSPAVIDTHEHIESLAKAEVLLSADEAYGIVKTILLPSPTETLTLNGYKSFTGYRENTDEIFKVSEKYPERFIPFCTVNPLDSDALKYIKGCIERGGKGIKLYNGHSYYYEVFSIPLDSPRMTPIYAFAQRNKIPLLFHINITKYGKELERVLDAYPDLVISIPHFMVSSIGLDKVTALLDKYPNMYTDMSFGSPEFMASGFRRISKNPEKYGNFINNYKDQILFGTDMVLTNSEEKDLNFMDETIGCYKDLLEERQFECRPVSSYYENVLKAKELSYKQCKPKEGAYCMSMKDKVEVYQERLNEVIKLNGLNLSHSTLGRIYWTNPNRFLNANN